jgi:two-component system cell cycle response regulator
MRILIAEDSPIDRMLIQTILSGEGHDVIETEDGEQSWEILQSPDAPKLVILDWLMPGIDGLEVCRRLRQIPDRAYVFVMLLTANDKRHQLLEGLSAGADDYLAKPIDPAVLVARVNVAQRILNLQADLLAAQEKLRFQADHDSLTGLFNRAAILSTLDREMSRAQRTGTPLGIVMGDVDHFKRINDTYGHAAGDSALREVARRFTASVRQYDMVGRLGGEEFLVLLPGCDADATRSRAARLCESIAESPLVDDDLTIPMTISLGGASFDPGSVEKASTLVARADEAMYRAKHSGRNRVEMSRTSPH